MEFPELGQHCSYKYCKQLDFLPMKCDACDAIFCKDHVTYYRHSCSSSHKKNVQVPVCPLCNKPVPVARGELPDIKVGQHIDNDCQSDPAKAKRNSDRHRCTLKGCRQVEFVPVICSSCRKNFCLKHRNPLDHECKGYDNSGRPVTDAGAAALTRHQNKSQGGSLLNHLKNFNISKTVHSPTSTPSAVSSGASASMNEDEALALALQMSMNDLEGGSEKPLTSQEKEDQLLAEALARSEHDFATEQQRQREMKKNCAVA